MTRELLVHGTAAAQRERERESSRGGHTNPRTKEQRAGQTPEGDDAHMCDGSSNPVSAFHVVCHSLTRLFLLPCRRRCAPLPIDPHAVIRRARRPRIMQCNGLWSTSGEGTRPSHIAVAVHGHRGRTGMGPHREPADAEEGRRGCSTTRDDETKSACSRQCAHGRLSLVHSLSPVCSSACPSENRPSIRQLRDTTQRQ